MKKAECDTQLILFDSLINIFCNIEMRIFTFRVFAKRSGNPRPYLNFSMPSIVDAIWSVRACRSNLPFSAVARVGKPIVPLSV